MTENLMLATVIGGSIVLGLLVVVGIPVTLGMRHAARQRELEHIERLKALDLGRPLPGEAPEAGAEATGWNNTMGIWVPLGALGIAVFATSQNGANAWAVWLAAGAVGVTGLVCATILTLRAPAPAQPAARFDAPPPAKVVTEADEFDVVGRRG